MLKSSIIICFLLLSLCSDWVHAQSIFQSELSNSHSSHKSESNSESENSVNKKRKFAEIESSTSFSTLSGPSDQWGLPDFPHLPAFSEIFSEFSGLPDFSGHSDGGFLRSPVLFHNQDSTTDFTADLEPPFKLSRTGSGLDAFDKNDFWDLLVKECSVELKEA